MPDVVWFRRDLRIGDNPTIAAAASSDGSAVPLFVLDPTVWDPASDVRRAYLSASLRALDTDLGGHLLVLHGDPVEAVVRAAKAAGAKSVHIAADFGPYGVQRD
ncbi:MAG: deoxyribodipyrimidine photo-lyase, partial [Candidatus Nanopelagicales bacterium]